MNRKKVWAILLTLAMVISSMTGLAQKEQAKASATESGAKETISCTVNGVERALIWSEDGDINFRVGDSETIDIYTDVDLISMKFDIYGTCWFYEGEDDGDYVLRWWNYDLLPDDYIMNVIPRLTSAGKYGYVDDVQSLILDADNNYIIGYWTFSGEAYALLTPEDMRKIFSTDNYFEYPAPKPLTNIPSPNPTATPQNTEKPVVTSKPTVSPTVEPTPAPTAKPTSAPTKTPSATITPTPTNTPSVSDKPVSVANVKVEIKSVKNKKSKKAVTSWKKVTGASGYQIAYSTNKKFKSKKTKNVTKTTVTLTKLKKKKTYYIKVRAYTKVNGKKVYGKWSAVKKVKVKK